MDDYDGRGEEKMPKQALLIQEEGEEEENRRRRRQRRRGGRQETSRPPRRRYFKCQKGAFFGEEMSLHGSEWRSMYGNNSSRFFFVSFLQSQVML